MANIEEKIEKLVKIPIEKIGYELYDVLYLKEGKDFVLRIVIDKENGITIEDCEKVNNEINDLLDEVDFLKDPYLLEVSSPGIERVLRKDSQIKKYIGYMVQISLFKKDENKIKEYVGILNKAEENYIFIEYENKEIKIERKNISQIRLKVEF